MREDEREMCPGEIEVAAQGLKESVDREQINESGSREYNGDY